MKNQERPTVRAEQLADETEVTKTDTELSAGTETQAERTEPGVGVETKRTRRQAKRELGEAVLAAERGSEERPAAAEQESEEGSAAAEPTEQIATEAAAVARSEQKAVVDAEDEVRYWANNYNTTEGQFRQFCQRLRRGEWELGPERYRENVRRYENDLAIDWQRSEEAVADLRQRGRGNGMYELAALQQLGSGVEPEDTIEAASGIFYHERAEQLAQVLRAAGADGEADLKTMGLTWRKVMNYLEATHDYDLLHEDYHSYQNGRRAAHNEMIRQLNTLNDLAERYQTPRFTIRNFMTNDFYYEARRDPGRALDHRANYDRESVMAYFALAFQQDFERERKRGERKERFY